MRLPVFLWSVKETDPGCIMRVVEVENLLNLLNTQHFINEINLSKQLQNLRSVLSPTNLHGILGKIQRKDQQPD